MVDISHRFLIEPLNEIVYQEYLTLLPQAMRNKILKFHRWQDAQLSLIGKILLLEALKKKGFEDNILEKIEYNDFGKPYLSKVQIDFNLSHSGNLVVCAISNCRIGVDVEKIEPINFDDFKRFFKEQEWQNIHNSPLPLHTFYSIWTQKEATLKAIGKGLNIPLAEIALSENKAVYQSETWYLQQIDIDSSYSMYVASEEKLAYV